MTKQLSWMLPEGIEEVLPGGEALALELVRRRLVDHFHVCGYQLIIPPMVEYLDSLLTGSGSDLALNTVSFVDRVSGRLLGIRADMTPQAARIDAHQLGAQGPSRLCYLGPVLQAEKARPGSSRNPLQLGAELFGVADVAADAEVFGLMLDALRLTGLDAVFVDVGHVGIFRALAAEAGLDEDAERRLFELLQRKAVPDIEAFLRQCEVDSAAAKRLLALADLNGDLSVLAVARSRLEGAGDAVWAALDEVEAFAQRAQRHIGVDKLHLDLAELRGYAYQTGIVFAAFVPDYGFDVARGGRYDHVGEYFGRARPATGFSADLKTLLRLAQRAGGKPSDVSRAPVLAPALDDPGLDQAVAALREQGVVVVKALGDNDAEHLGCDQCLVRDGEDWVLAKC